jgi:hypothetical protein
MIRVDAGVGPEMRVAPRYAGKLPWVCSGWQAGLRQVMYTGYIGRCRLVILIQLRGYLESGS